MSAVFFSGQPEAHFKALEGAARNLKEAFTSRVLLLRVRRGKGVGLRSADTHTVDQGKVMCVPFVRESFSFGVIAEGD